jgi:Sec-independent protein translocase protein TatA
VIIVDTPKADNDYCIRRRERNPAWLGGRRKSRVDRISLGIAEIIIFLVIALIVIPPEHLPEVMRTVGKILRELRLASNTVLREISGAIDEPYSRPPLPPAPPSAPAPAPVVAASPADTSATAAAETVENAGTERRP